MFDNNSYYENLKELARKKRTEYSVNTNSFGLREVRKIYKNEGIIIDQRPQLPSKIKAIYNCQDDSFSVAIKPSLPDAPKIFALIHELKHHYYDQSDIKGGILMCGDYNQNELIEKGAEVFAAEFIYPENDFLLDAIATGVTVWTPQDIVMFKKNCSAKISYLFIRKRLQRLRLISAGQFNDVKFQKLEEEMYGIPFYKFNKRRFSHQKI